MSQRETGIVKWFDSGKGYGFIQREDGADVFVHYKSIIGEGYRTVKQGDRVEFTLKEGPKGLQAEEVTAVAVSD